ncbi:hypothetical protein C8R45DRAFT_532939 [Mycena sanguinolenta]|nr:hypothetical protein C8R45DRAFT_532939 [Mycena sanguinolenta]
MRLCTAILVDQQQGGCILHADHICPIRSLHPFSALLLCIDNGRRSNPTQRAFESFPNTCLNQGHIFPHRTLSQSPSTRSTPNFDSALGLGSGAAACVSSTLELEPYQIYCPQCNIEIRSPNCIESRHFPPSAHCDLAQTYTQRDGVGVNRAFRDMIASVIHRTTGPVFIFLGDDIYSCWPRDVDAWDLQESFHAPRARDEDRRMGKTHTRAFPQEARPHPVDSRKNTAPYRGYHEHEALSLCAVSIQLVEGNKHRPCAILILNPGAVDTICLGRSYGADIPAVDLDGALVHVALPSLRHLIIGTDKADPTALRTFLANHPLVSTITFNVSGGVLTSTHNLIDPPLAPSPLPQRYEHAELCAPPLRAAGLSRLVRVWVLVPRDAPTRLALYSKTSASSSCGRATASSPCMSGSCSTPHN